MNVTVDVQPGERVVVDRRNTTDRFKFWHERRNGRSAREWAARLAEWKANVAMWNVCPSCRRPLHG